MQAEGRTAHDPQPHGARTASCSHRISVLEPSGMVRVPSMRHNDAIGFLVETVKAVPAMALAFASGTRCASSRDGSQRSCFGSEKSEI